MPPAPEQRQRCGCGAGGSAGSALAGGSVDRRRSRRRSRCRRLRGQAQVRLGERGGGGAAGGGSWGRPGCLRSHGPVSPAPPAPAEIVRTVASPCHLGSDETRTGGSGAGGGNGSQLWRLSDTNGDESPGPSASTIVRDGSQDDRSHHDREHATNQSRSSIDALHGRLRQQPADPIDQPASGCVQGQHRLQTSQFLELRERGRVDRLDRRTTSTTMSSQQCSRSMRI